VLRALYAIGGSALKRDLDLIREIVLVTEAAKPAQCVSLKDFEESHAGKLEEVSEHVQFLDRAGHDYLDAVRDSGIWSKTQQQLKKLSGSATLEVVKAVAAKKYVAGIGCLGGTNMRITSASDAKSWKIANITRAPEKLSAGLIADELN
tara:strand:- start:472 stop:918 length:447 start_codon:yes stop_codon:yes gene_type:complete